MEGECPHCGTHQTFVAPAPESPFANAAPPEPVDLKQQDAGQGAVVAAAKDACIVPGPIPGLADSTHTAPSAPTDPETNPTSGLVADSQEVPPSIPPARAEVPATVENPSNPLPALEPPLQPAPQVVAVSPEATPTSPDTVANSQSGVIPSVPAPAPTPEASLPPVAPSSPELPPVPEPEELPVPSSPELAGDTTAVQESGRAPFSAVKPTSTSSTPPPLPQAPSTPEVPAYLLNLYGEQKPSKQKKGTNPEASTAKAPSPGKRKHSPLVDILAVSLITVLLAGVGYLAWIKFSPGESDTPSAKANVPALTQASEGKTAGQAK